MLQRGSILGIVETMVLILDGSSDIGAHIRRNRRMKVWWGGKGKGVREKQENFSINEEKYFSRGEFAYVFHHYVFAQYIPLYATEI